jgi:peroxiredoxin
LFNQQAEPTVTGMPTTTSKTSLAPATEELRAGLARQLGEEVLDAFDRDAEAMGGDPPYAGALDVGATAPEFTLPDARGGQVSLSTLLAVGPVVLVFYRGAWCPYCNLQLSAFQAALPEIRHAGATLVAVSPQTPDQSLTLAERHALEYPVLSDSGNAVAGEYGLVFTMSNAITETMGGLGVRLSDYNGDESNTLPAATTFVIGQDGVIRFAAVSGDYRWRVGPQEALAALRG